MANCNFLPTTPGYGLGPSARIAEMGSYAECWLGSFYVGVTKNDIDPGLMSLFRSTDKVTLHGKKQDLPFQMRRWNNFIEDDEDVCVVFYRAPARIIRDRLELKGYTLTTARSAFTTSICSEAAQHAGWLDRPNGQIFEPIVRILQSTDVDQWLSALRLIKEKDLQRRDQGGRSNEYDGTLVGYMLDNDWYGYSGPDTNVALRLALEVCSDGDELIYDVTDLVMSEYFSEDDDLVSYALGLYSGDYSSTSKMIVLTEGRSDSWIISESIKLLYPHLCDYFTFMDFDGVRIGGGAGGLANIVKAFAGAGILNKLVAVFDNDTAAEAAIRSLRSVKLPANIRILRLPELLSLNEYPTIGPSGPVTMNVNGIAASIELYLGRDALLGEDGRLAPVQWTGYEPGVGKYQGEVLFKDRIHERFKRRLEACRGESGLTTRPEWAGVQAILSSIFVAFHDFDAQLINSGIREYYDD